MVVSDASGLIARITQVNEQRLNNLRHGLSTVVASAHTILFLEDVWTPPPFSAQLSDAVALAERCLESAHSELEFIRVYVVLGTVLRAYRAAAKST